MAEQRVDHIFSLLTPTTSWTPVGNKQARHNQKTHDWGRDDLVIFKGGQKVAWTKLGKTGHFLNVSQMTVQSKDHLKIRRQKPGGRWGEAPVTFQESYVSSQAPTGARGDLSQTSQPCGKPLCVQGGKRDGSVPASVAQCKAALVRRPLCRGSHCCQPIAASSSES